MGKPGEKIETACRGDGVNSTICEAHPQTKAACELLGFLKKKMANR